MSRKIFFILISLLLISPALVPAFSVFRATETRVCGVDNKNYPSTKVARNLGVEVSYEFPCQFPKTEKNLFERKKPFEFTGMLLDFFVNNNQSHFFLRDNFDKKEYLVIFKGNNINNYLPGDQLRVKGEINKNLELITATNLVNLSGERGDTYDCFLKNKNELSKEIQCQYHDKLFNFFYDNKTKFVLGLLNPASAKDLNINDYLRVRVDDSKNAKIIIVEKRGQIVFLKNHIFESRAKLLSKNIQKKYLKISLNKYPNSIFAMNSSDKLINLKIKNDTRIVKKYFGRLSLEDFKIGDDLYIIGRANDDGSFEAITIKNNSVWK